MNYAVILSAGIGKRMRDDGFPKQYIEVCGKPVLVYTLEVFEQCNDIDEIIIVCDPAWEENIREWIVEYDIEKSIHFCPGGSSRQESIFNGIIECMRTSQGEEDKVIIHDAARPLVTDDLLERCLDVLPDYDGCMPVLPSVDTYYLSEDGKSISSLINRSSLYAGQAPEAFMLHKYFRVNDSVAPSDLAKIRGTTEIAYKAGLNIMLTAGEELNFKLTTPADLKRFQTIVEARKNESVSAV